MKEGWKRVKLSDVFETVTGSTPSKKKPEYYGGVIPFVKPPELKNCEITDASDTLSEAGAELARVLPVGSILVSCIGNLGKIGIARTPCASNQQINSIKPNASLATPEFIFYQALSDSFSNQLNELATGTTLSIVNKSKFNSIEIPIPPLSEQEEIVEVLDTAFAAIDQAKANIDQNIANAKELFQSKLNQIFSQKGEGWVETTLGEVCENLDSRRVPITKNKRTEGPIPYYGASGIVDYVADYIFDEDLLLVSEDGANLLARTYPIAFSISGKTWVNNHAHVLRFKEMTSQIFIEHYLNSIKLDDYISGMAQPKLNQKKLNSITVPFPDLAQQEKTISVVVALNERMKELSSTYQTKLASLDELKKSILQKAFAGELT